NDQSLCREDLLLSPARVRTADRIDRNIIPSSDALQGVPCANSVNNYPRLSFGAHDEAKNEHQTRRLQSPRERQHGVKFMCGELPPTKYLHQGEIQTISWQQVGAGLPGAVVRAPLAPTTREKPWISINEALDPFLDNRGFA